jgi:ribonuclease P protein component
MFSAKNKLKNRKDFQKVYREGKVISSGKVVFRFFKSGLPQTRIGIVVGKAMASKSTRRNRLKRILRESIRQYYGQIKPNYDIIISLVPKIKKKEKNEFKKITGDMEEILKKSKIIK